jgi:hypothetical protein
MYEKLKKWKERCDKTGSVDFSLNHYGDDITIFLHFKKSEDNTCVMITEGTSKCKTLETLL